jgi:imidazolonepropionase-like amidohydrolase
MPRLLLSNIGRLFTATADGVVNGAAVSVDGGRIAWFGPQAEAPGGWDDRIDVEGALLTPGLIDAHTHPVYAGNRLAEISLRSTGAGYAEIAAAGGGIQSTVAATRAASEAELATLVRHRLQSWLAAGTTTVEAKSGYHLDHAGELAALRLLTSFIGAAASPPHHPASPGGSAGVGGARGSASGSGAVTGGGEAGAGSEQGPGLGSGGVAGGGRPFRPASPRGSAVGQAGQAGDRATRPPADSSWAGATQSVVSGDAASTSGLGEDGWRSGGGVASVARVEVTFLGAHDVAPERVGERDPHGACAADVAGWMGEAAAAGARFVDVFCDAGYFPVEEARRVLLAGNAAGLLPRVHADELERTGGSLLAAEVGAVSADHLLCATDEDARALAAAGVVATLCPVTAMAMGRTPPARMLVEHGVTLALGTDHNPGMSGTTSMSLVVGLAVHVLGLSVDEALTAATAGGARSVATPDRGVIRPGATADLVAWDTDHEGGFAWDLGLRPRQVWKGGQLHA